MKGEVAWGLARLGFEVVSAAVVRAVVRDGLTDTLGGLCFVSRDQCWKIINAWRQK